ncbi:MAG: nitroreductase/quinone reductase family protein [Gammaproteobacteria bacterium]|nr:nitroreductase/quinone reductase family protein [Gammaproteobacteria bacterium]
MKAVKIFTILILVYVGMVIVFESLLGYYQPENQSTLIITTTDEDGIEKNRVLARLESNGQLYIAANHWPRAWYYQTLDNPNVQITFEGDTSDYLAVPVTGEEHERVNSDNRHSIVFRILVGFAPRYFFRLEPR